MTFPDSERCHQSFDLGYGLALQRRKQRSFLVLVYPSLARQPLEYPHMPQVQGYVPHSRYFQGSQHQAQYLHVAFNARVPVQLGANLQGTA